MRRNLLWSMTVVATAFALFLVGCGGNDATTGDDVAAPAKEAATEQEASGNEVTPEEAEPEDAEPEETGAWVRVKTVSTPLTDDEHILGTVTDCVLDEHGNVIEQVDYVPVETDKGEEKRYSSCQRIEYDENGYVVRSWRGQSPDDFDDSQMSDVSEWKITRDDSDRIVRAADDTTEMKYEYDEQGNIVKKVITAVDQYVTTYTIDSEGWTTAVSFEPTEEYAEANNTRASNTTFEFERDADGRVISRTMNGDQAKTVYEYTYDKDGNIASEKFSFLNPDGSEIEGGYPMLYEYTYQYVEDPSPRIALESRLH